MVVLLTVATLLASVLGEVAVIDEAGALVHDTPFALPLLDFSPFMRDEGVVVDEAPTAAQRETARELDQVARAHGFVALTRFGVDRALLQRAWNESAQLFALPPERKRALAQISAETNRGYSGLGRESLNRNRAGEPKEAFNVRRAGNNYTGVPDGFATVAATLWARLERAARRYALAAAVALGLPRDYFHATLRELDLCTLRFLHYPPNATAVTTGAPREALRVGEHTDFGLVTFLFLSDGAVGLQLKAVDGAEIGGAAGGEAGGWRDVAVPPSGGGDDVVAIVNTGALLARWTNDFWRATAHRVIVPDAAAAASPRYSIAAFFDPDSDAEVAVHPRFVRPGEAPRYPPTTGLAFLLMKLKEAQGDPA